MAVGYTNFPAAIDSYETLLRLGLGTETHLLQPITADMTSLVVSDPSRLSTPSGILLVGNEWVTYTGMTGNVASGLARGQFQDDGGYPSVAHPDGERVIQFMTPIHHRVLADAIIAIQTAIGAGTLAETVQDIVGALVGDSASIAAQYNDAGNVETLVVIPEAIQDIIGAMVQDSSTIDATYNDAGNVESLEVIPEAIQDIVGALIADSTSIDATYNDAGNLESLAVIYGGTGAASTAARSDHNHHTDSALVHPVGSIIMYGGSSSPTGWLLCDGTAVSRTTFATLFTAIGTAYGAGDGSTTFNVPNFKSRMPFGLDAAQATNDTRGETGGARTVTLTAAESGLPAHNHGTSALATNNTGAHTHTGPQFSENNNTETNGNADRLINDIAGSGGAATGSNGAHQHTITGNVDNNSATPASSAHENLPPFLVVNFIVKT